MDLKQAFENQLRQPMNRRQFLVRVGGIALSLLGVTAIIRSLEDRATNANSSNADLNSGYGGSSYGKR